MAPVSAPRAAPLPAVPELGPSLGRVVVPWRHQDSWVPIDDVRDALATAILEHAGSGRAAAVAADLHGLLKVTSRAAWLEPWEGAVQRVADRVCERIDAEIERAGQRARMPARMRHERRLTAAERRAVAARLAAGGGAFVAALDALDERAAALRAATVPLDAEVRWREGILGAARRLEAAWLALEGAVEDEAGRWAREIAAVAGWRPSLRPLILLWIPGAAVLLWLALALGGYVTVPGWLGSWLGF